MSCALTSRATSSAATSRDPYSRCAWLWRLSDSFQPTAAPRVMGPGLQAEEATTDAKYPTIPIRPHAPSRSRGADRARAVAANSSPLRKRAQGKPGARCTRGLVCKGVEENAHEHTGSAEALRPSLRNGFTAYFVLSPAIGLSCHRRWRLEALTDPVGLAGHHQLDAGVEASGPHDFTVRDRLRWSFRRAWYPSAEFWRRRDQHRSSARLLIAHGQSPPCDLTRARRCRVHRIPPRVRDDREPPLMWDETAGVMKVICVKGEEEIFFRKGLDRQSGDLPVEAGQELGILGS